MSLFDWAKQNDARKAAREYRRAPPGYRIKRRREWVLAMARAL